MPAWSFGNAADLTALLDDRYGADVVALAPIGVPSDKGVFRVDRAHGPPWVLRAFASDRATERMLGDAAILAYLAEHGFPAERVVPARDGSLLMVRDGRGFLVTDYVAGDYPDTSTDTLHRLGEIVGRLHSLPRPAAEASPLLRRRAGIVPAQKVPLALDRLAGVANRVPPDLQRRYGAVLEGLHALRWCDDVAPVLIHNDLHVDNALVTPAGGIVLIDWDGAGFGPAVMDLGFLLFSVDVAVPGRAPLPPDPTRVEAVVDGYCRHRIPPPRELDLLPDALRFRSLVRTGSRLVHAIETGCPLDEAQWWAQPFDADALADRARRRFRRHLLAL